MSPALLGVDIKDLCRLGPVEVIPNAISLYIWILEACLATFPTTRELAALLFSSPETYGHRSNGMITKTNQGPVKALYYVC